MRSPRYLSSQMRQLWSVVLGFEVGLVDPGLGHHDRWVWSATESLGVGVVGGGQGVLPVLVDRVGGAEVDRGRGVPRDPGMAVDVVVLVEEAGTELWAAAVFSDSGVGGFSYAARAGCW